VSDTLKLTPALSTPGRDLPRQEIYKGLVDRAAGRVKDLDVDAILTKGKELFQKRSISNVRQFGVDGRKTLFLLLLLFAIPADDCSAQTPPPPVDEHAFESVPPTVVKSPAPFNPAAPSATPTVVFTPSPSPAPPTAKPSDPGSPQPRRTAIPATPSRVPEN